MEALIDINEDEPMNALRDTGDPMFQEYHDHSTDHFLSTKVFALQSGEEEAVKIVVAKCHKSNLCSHT